MKTRRDFLTAAAAGMALAGIGPAIAPAWAADEITFFTPLGILPEFIDVLNAAAGGHFAAQGIDATVLGAMGVQSLQQLVANKGQFIRNTGLDLIKGVAMQGLPVVAIATLAQGSTFHLVSLAAKPVPDAASLRGKTIGLLTAQGGASSIYLDVILAKAGIAKDDVRYEVTGNNPGEIEFLKSGRVDCFMCTLDVVTRLEMAKAPITYWSTDKYLPMPSQIYVTRRDIVERQPDLVLRFLRAIKASVDEILTQPLAGLYERIETKFDVPGLKDMATAVTVQQASIDKLWLSEGRSNLLRNVPALWQSGVTALRQNGVPNIQDATVYYTNTFIDQALKA